MPPTKSEVRPRNKKMIRDVGVLQPCNPLKRAPKLSVISDVCCRSPRPCLLRDLLASQDESYN